MKMIDHELPQAINFIDVTLRDGEQQTKRHPEMPVDQRLEVFDLLVGAGIQHIEVGHAANPHDQNFLQTLGNHIAASGDERMRGVTLQVLLGSQQELLEPSLKSLNGIENNTTIQLYDRLSPHLRGLASEPYSAEEAANRVAHAARVAQDLGFNQLAIAGEGAVDPTLPRQQVLDFYLSIASQIINSETTITANLANTFGASPIGEWNEAGLADFNTQLKNLSSRIKTAVHTHNDYGTATDFAMAAVHAGFDIVEGTFIGMGERTGNVALTSVMGRLLEDARVHVELQKRGDPAATAALLDSLWNSRYVSDATTKALSTWYQTASGIEDIYLAGRLNRTPLGSETAYDAGAGPHSQANLAALKDPTKRPLWMNYGRAALTDAILGRPEATEILQASPSRLRGITLQNHASGGSTAKVHSGDFTPASSNDREIALRMATDEIHLILGLMTTGAHRGA